MKTRLIVTCSALALWLGGCSLTPEFVQPDLPVPDAWPAEGAKAPLQPGLQPGAKPAAAQAPGAEQSWSQFFTDPRLQGLIRQALEYNRDLRVAALNIEVARASYGVAQADLLPTVNAGAGDTIARTPADLSSVGKATTSRKYTASLGVSSFELDLFGRLRSLEDQALEQFFATEEARVATQISLIAEVANAWLTLLADRKQLALADETLATRQKSFGLIQQSFQRGIGTELDVAQARTAVETARTTQVRLKRQVAQDKNALVLLLGGPLNEARLIEGVTLDSVRLIENLPVGLPSQVLLRRPDIQQAEHSLKAANANIGAARAAFFPTISLTGSLGTASASLTGLFGAGSGAWSFGPQISVPIFDYGRNEATLESAKANQQITVAQYEKAIQSAFREVADALVARATLNDQLAAQHALVEASQANYRLAQARYQAGIDSYLTVLDAQRSLFSAQQDEITVQATRLSNLVTLYKVLGGGRT